jgi:hypothetical protein
MKMMGKFLKMVKKFYYQWIYMKNYNNKGLSMTD